MEGKDSLYRELLDDFEQQGEESTQDYTSSIRRARRIALGTGAALAFGAAAAIGLASRGEQVEYVPNEVMVKFASELDISLEADGNVLTGYEDVDRINAMLDGEQYEQFVAHSDEHELDQWYAITLPEGEELDSALELFAAAGGVLSAEKIPIGHPDYMETDLSDAELQALEERIENNIPNDPFFHSEDSWGQGYKDLWGLYNTEAVGAWEITKGSEDIILAITDTGVDYNHPDIAGRVITSFDYDFVNMDSNAMDDHGHGTHVAGTIAAKTDNGIGVAGATWEAQILPIKVCNAYGGCSWKDVSRGFVYAADNGASAVNVSLGSRSQTPGYMAEAIEYATLKGTFIVTSAGNSNDNSWNWTPANHPLVLVIGATDVDDEKTSFSNWGDKVDVGAPGDNILSLLAEQNNLGGRPIVGDNYVVLRGTSMACPHAVADLGLILSVNPDIDTFEEAQAALQAGVDRYGEGEVPEPPELLGTGRINYRIAVEKASE